MRSYADIIWISASQTCRHEDRWSMQGLLFLLISYFFLFYQIAWQKSRRNKKSKHAKEVHERVSFD
jgi:hypothetical protein